MSQHSFSSYTKRQIPRSNDDFSWNKLVSLVLIKVLYLSIFPLYTAPKWPAEVKEQSEAGTPRGTGPYEDDVCSSSLKNGEQSAQGHIPIMTRKQYIYIIVKLLATLTYMHIWPES